MSKSRGWILGMLVAAAMAVGVQAAPGLPLAQADRDFLAARDAFRAGDAAKLDKLAVLLDGYPLAPYARYWQLKVHIDDVDPDAVHLFLSEYRDSLLADRLRNGWLKALGKKGSWDLFVQEYPLVQAEDTELACYGLQQRMVTRRAETLAEAKRLWFTGSETPESCDPLFDAMLDKGVLNERDVWTRFQLAADAGNFALAQRINGKLVSAHQIAPKDLERANRNPEHLLSKNEFRGATIAGRELALYGLKRAVSRLGRGGLDGVADAWRRARRQLPPGIAQIGNGVIAYAAARRLAPDALAWYREAGAAQLSDNQLAWKARAALREQAWDEVLSAIAAMSSVQQHDPAWRYWKARALAARGQAVEARTLLELLAYDVSFYGLLASEETGISTNAKSEPVLPTPAELADLDSLPSVQRMLKFYQLDLRPEALREWIWTIRNFDDRERLIAAQYALSKGLFDRAINTADTTVARHDFALRYMAPYKDALTEAAQQIGLDEALVFGLVRQESRFRADAVSSAGAVGLMQLMPPTAKWVAKQLGKTDYRPSQIGDVATNAKFGAYYFKYWLDRFENLSLLAVAGYNAGPGRAQAWRSARPIEGAIYAETIPFNETRDYVKKVLANAVLYSRQFGSAGPSLEAAPGDHSAPRRETRRDRSRGSSGDRKMKHDKIVVLGGSGFVGRHIMNVLASQERDVIVPSRAREHAKALFLLPRAEIPEVDVRDASALAAATRGADAVINLVGILHETRHASFTDIHVGVTEAVIEACRTNGIRRLVHMSALNADPAGPSAYLRSKGEAQARVMASGLDWTVFQPSVIFGPEDRFLNLFAFLAKFMPVIYLARADARFQPVYVGDVAAAMVAALDDDSTIGQCYPLCGPTIYTLRELVAFAASQAGYRRLIVGLPEGLAIAQACVLEHLPGKLMTRDNLLSMRVDSVCNCPFPAVFGGSPRAIEDTVPAYLSPKGETDPYFDPTPAPPVKIYRVGGSVRDELLGQPVTDRDYVVVGATPETLIALGFQPVGRDFPVFLHPQTHEEYALARTERKEGRGHQGFVFHADPGVTLEADLLRRDLTINAMARDEAGTLIDPYGGQRDLDLRVLRHISPAFGEDPLRVLRVARFAARFGFAVAEDTEALMRELVAHGEMRDLSPERVWQELAQGLVARQPSRMLAVLRRCGALREVAPELDGLFGGAAAGQQPDLGVRTALALDRGAAVEGAPPALAVQFAIAARHLSIAHAETLAARLRVSADCRDAAINAIRHTATLDRTDALSAEEWLSLLGGLDALRRPERLDVLLAVHAAHAACDFPGPADNAGADRIRARATTALQVLAGIDYDRLKADEEDGIAQRVQRLRLEALRKWLAGIPAEN